jgi:hypothetical protein
MSGVVRTGVSRRPLLAGLVAVLGLGAAGAVVYEIPRLFGRRYPRTKYDDLLDQLGDRESAAKLGRASLAELNAINDTAPAFDPAQAAADLRKGPGKGSLVQTVDADLALGRLIEIHGWVLPLSLVMVSSIAASTAANP